MVKLAEKSAGDRQGQLIISLDFELFWGVHDIFSKELYAENIYGAHQAVPEILKVFESYGIRATWAVVGMLYLDSRREFYANIPDRVPEYARKKLSPYYYANQHLLRKQEYDLYFAPDLIRSISETAGQEIGSHTFSHYYCLEKGQSLDTFVADAETFYKVIRPKGKRMQSIIFPRNQINREYLSTCRELGFIAYRGNEKGWIYHIRQNDQQHIIKRGLRFIDMYVNLFGHQTYAVPSVEEGLPVNIPGSRQLKPVSSFKWLEQRRLNRILRAMTYAAKKGEIYHLWWHPHNFGIHLEENLNFLRRILKHYRELEHLYGFQSVNMGELAADLLEVQMEQPNELEGAVR